MEKLGRAGFVGTWTAGRKEDLREQSPLLCLLWKLP